MNRRLAQLTTALGATLGTVSFVALAPAGTTAAATPAPRDLICELVGTCPADPDDDTVVVIDLDDVGGTVGEVADTTVGTLDTVLPGAPDPLAGLPVEQLPAPVGGVLVGVTGGAAEPTLEIVAETAETAVNGALDDVTDVVDDTLNQVGLGDVVVADAQIPVDLTEGVVVDPTADASVDLGGATSELLPLPELLDADVAASLCGVNVVVLADHAQDCADAAPAPATIGAPLLGDLKLPIDVCGVQVAVLGSDHVDCSGSGGNQNGGATGGLSDALAGIGAAVGLCGVQVGVLGSATAECAGRGTGLGGDLCLAAGTCIALPGIDTLCGIQIGVAGQLGVECVASGPGGPGTPGQPGTPDDPGTPEGPGTPTDPGVDPGTDPGDSPEGIGNGDGDTPEGVGNGDGDTPEGVGVGDGSGTGQPGGTAGGTDGGGTGSLPLTGSSVATLLGLGAALIATGMIARRFRGLAAVR